MNDELEPASSYGKGAFLLPKGGEACHDLRISI